MAFLSASLLKTCVFLVVAITLSPGLPSAKDQGGLPALVDVTREAGLGGFKNTQGSLSKEHIVETMGGGAAFLDYNGDGNLDILLVRGSSIQQFQKGGDPMCSLFGGDGRGHFHDVTKEADIKVRGWGMGVTAGDIDNDGWEDIFLAGYGPNYLLKNNGNGTFSDITEIAGVADARWSVAAAFGDLDRDGDLDLYVVNYLEYDLNRLPDRKASCTYRGFDVFCGPRGLPGSRDTLYLNDGKGRFLDVTEAKKIDPEKLYGMGVVISDYDNDTWPDILVVNDLTPNLLYRNLGKGEFEEGAVLAGAAFDENGVEEGSMGVDFGDFNNDGLLDFYYTNSSYQTNQLGLNMKNGNFSLKTYAMGHGETTWLYVGWGTFFADLDNDGWEEIFVVNGHLYPEADRFDMGLKYRQRPLLFLNQGGKTFVEAKGTWGPAVNESHLGRGAAYGDIDNDGDLDILANNLDGPPTLLRNDGGSRQSWLQVQCNGTASNRSAVGTRLTLSAGRHKQIREIKAGHSYGSRSDPRVHFGLGSATEADELEIRWPSGKVQKLTKLRANQLLKVKEPAL